MYLISWKQKVGTCFGTEVETTDQSEACESTEEAESLMKQLEKTDDTLNTSTGLIYYKPYSVRCHQLTQAAS